ncbi:MAG: PHB depolymerase family esterase, partial [Ktedonobacteraceae bacterium]
MKCLKTGLVAARGVYEAVWLTALLGSLLLAGCTTTPAAQSPQAGSTPSWTPPSQSQINYEPINRPLSTTGCGLASPIAPGRSAGVTIASHPAVSEGQRTRTYRVHVPTIYEAHQSVPVVLVFHGYTGTATGMEQGSGFSQLADQENFIAVYPQGLPDGDGGAPFWASVGPIDNGVDDVLFVSDILSDLQRKFCIDARRIYVTGFSNGGGMTGFLACRLAGRVAAFAPVSGNFYNPPGGCSPGRPVPILDFHGTADHVLPYNGIPASENAAWPLPPVSQWLQTWA